MLTIRSQASQPTVHEGKDKEDEEDSGLWVAIAEAF